MWFSLTPPALKYYITDQDSTKEKRDKTQWWAEIKNQEPEFDFNEDAVVYCIKDVEILRGAIVKFPKQTFEFGQQMIDHFGPSPNWKSNLAHPFFHPFSQATPTLSAFR